MKNQIVLLSLFIFLLSLTAPVNCLSQTIVTYTKTSLSRMNVLSRSALFEPAIAEAAQKEGVDPQVLWVIAYNESRFRPWMTSPKNAQGLMQFMPATAARFGLTDPYEPRSSIFAAAKYVKVLGGMFGWRLDSILAAYNAGEGTVSAYLSGKTIVANGKRINPLGKRTNGGVPPYKETRNYVANGLKVYRWLATQRILTGVKYELVATSSILKETSLNSVNSVGSTVPEPDNKEKNDFRRDIVYYDPRSGKRLRYGGDKNPRLTLLEESGPVIVSPETRTATEQLARSTFAGRPR